MHLPALRHLRPDRPLAVLALAATGPDPATARVVVIAVARLDPPAVLGRRVAPRVQAGATAAHGLADRHVAVCPPFARLAPAVRRLLAGCDLVGFGVARHPLPLLAAELARCGLPFGASGRQATEAPTASGPSHPFPSAAVGPYLGWDPAGAHPAGTGTPVALQTSVRARRAGE